MSKSIFFRLIFLAFLSIFFTACAKETRNPLPVDTVFKISIGKIQIEAKLMINDFEKAQGLMFVKSIPENFGMFFIYEQPQKMSFWMKNTEIPLDLAFFDSNGILLEIKSLFPHNLNSVNSSSANALYALETNAGWFAKNNISIGEKLDINALKEAIKARAKN